jgi:hypothetical protein
MNTIYGPIVQLPILVDGTETVYTLALNSLPASLGIPPAPWALDPTQIGIFVNGVQVQNATSSYNAQTNTITITLPAAPGKAIQVNLRLVFLYTFA